MENKVMAWPQKIMAIQKEAMTNVIELEPSDKEIEVPVLKKIAGISIGIQQGTKSMFLQYMKDFSYIDNEHKKKFNKKPLFIIPQKIWDKGISAHPDLFDFRYINDEGQIVVSTERENDYTPMLWTLFNLGSMVGFLVFMALFLINLFNSNNHFQLIYPLGVIGMVVLTCIFAPIMQIKAEKEFEKASEKDARVALPKKRDYPVPKKRADGTTPIHKTMKVRFINCPNHFQESLIAMKEAGIHPSIMAHISAFSLGKLKTMGSDPLPKDPTVYYIISIKERNYVVGTDSFGNIPEEEKFINGIRSAIASLLQMN